MRKFRDLQQVRNDIKSMMPLNEIIEMIDGYRLERVSNDLYKKRCDLDSHPADDDGTKDSTPSFTVSPSKELWYCFGCGNGGDRFEYLSQKRHIDHIQSIEEIAKMIGFDLTPYYEEVTPEEQFKNNLFIENNKAMELAHNCLLADDKALNYLVGRGISLESIERFKIGYVPELTSDNVTFFDQIPNKLALHLDKKQMFNDAIVFPVCDPYGRMKYFRSRPFRPLPGMKYIGVERSHPLYDEDNVVYAFDVARRDIGKHNGRLVGVEGSPDAIVCNQHGIPTIALLGTTMNEKTFTFLDKYRVTEFVLLLDGDKAGYDRSIKIAEKYLLLTTNVKLRIAMMPEGYDPDEYINKFGSDKMKEIIDTSIHASQYLLDHIWNEVNPTTPTTKIDYLSRVEKYITNIKNVLTKNMFIQYIADKLNFNPEEIQNYYSNTTQNESVLYSIGGEEILLGEALRDKDFLIDLTVQFGNDDWYINKHKILFKILKEAKHTDIESLSMTIKNMELNNIITDDWLRSIYNKQGNIEFALDDVKDKLIRRKVKHNISAMNDEIVNLSSDPQIIIDKYTNAIYNAVFQKSDDIVVNGEQQVTSVMNLIQERMQSDSLIIGYDFGPNFKKLTRVLLGLQTKTLTVISANQSVGKTQLAENLIVPMSINNQVSSLWFALEMSTDNMTFRNLSLLSGVPLESLLTGNVTADDMIKSVTPWAVKLANAPFYLTNQGAELGEALAIARRHVMKYKTKVIIVDYAQLQYVGDARRNLARHMELGVISKSWKKFSMEMDVAVILISQLSKEALKEAIAKAEHGSGSYEIAQDADNYITLKERSAEEIAQSGIERGNIILNVDKNRMGQADVLIPIYSDRPIQRMMEV